MRKMTAFNNVQQAVALCVSFVKALICMLICDCAKLRVFDTFKFAYLSMQPLLYVDMHFEGSHLI